MRGGHNKLTQAEVDAWLATNRPDFKPVDGWVYVNTDTPIPGRCLVEGCGAECAPRLGDMKTSDTGHCAACGKRARREHGETEARRVAEERGYEVVGFFAKQYIHSWGNRVYNKMYATLRCDCGNEWDVAQSDLCSRGSGCGNCAEFGYDSSKPGAIYLLARSVLGIEQRAYGISNDWPTRIKGYERFGWLPLDILEFKSGQSARDTESMLNRVVASVAGRTVDPDHIKYKNREAYAAGHGIPVFNSVWSFMCWGASVDSRSEVHV